MLKFHQKTPTKVNYPPLPFEIECFAKSNINYNYLFNLPFNFLYSEREQFISYYSHL